MHLKSLFYDPDVEGMMDKKDYRRCGYVYVGWIQDENGHGWYAIPGFYTLTFTLDSKGEVQEWNENNNKMEINILVSEKKKEEVYPNDGGKENGTSGIAAWASAKVVTYGDKPGMAYSKINSFWSYGGAYTITWLEVNNLHTEKTIDRIIFNGFLKGCFNNYVEFFLFKYFLQIQCRFQGFRSCSRTIF